MEVLALDAADPLALVGQVEFPGAGNPIHVAFADRRLFIASPSLRPGGEACGPQDRRPPAAENPGRFCTRLTVVDADPRGGVVVRGQVFLPGAVGHASHLGLLDQGAALAVAAGQTASANEPGAALYTLEITATGEPRPLASVAIPDQLAAAALSGSRAALGGASALSLIDLSSSGAPAVASTVALPSVPDCLQFAGDSLLVLGHEEGPPGERPALDVALYGVQDLQRPVLRARESFALPGYNRALSGGDGRPLWWIACDGRLLLVPFEAIRRDRPAEGRLQLLELDLAAGRLVKRGSLDRPEDLRHIFPRPDGRLLAVGGHLVALDASDPDVPARVPPSTSSVS